MRPYFSCSSESYSKNARYRPLLRGQNTHVRNLNVSHSPTSQDRISTSPTLTVKLTTSILSSFFPFVLVSKVEFMGTIRRKFFLFTQTANRHLHLLYSHVKRYCPLKIIHALPCQLDGLLLTAGDHLQTPLTLL